MRRAFTILELVVAVGMMGMLSGAAWNLMSGGAKALSSAGDHQVALRNALILTTSLDQDFRAAAVLNARREYQQSLPASPHSVVLSASRTSVRLRVSAPIESLDADPASRYTIVTYQLVEHKEKKGRFVIRREEHTASGKTIPGDRTARRSHTFEDLTLSGMRLRMVAWLGPLEWRQFVTMSLTAVEGQTPQGAPREHSITRQFDVAVPPPPHGSAGGPKGFAMDFPASAMAGQLAGGFDLVGRPGNTEPLEVPPDAVDRRGRPVELDPEQEAGTVTDPFERLEPAAGPLKSQFLHAAMEKLEGAVGATYRGAICGQLADDFRFRLDCSESATKPLITQLDELIERVRPRGPAMMVQLLHRMQMETFPGSELPPLQAAAQLIGEAKGAAN